jgi:predicted tellurium resistance membrane protein TerC
VLTLMDRFPAVITGGGALLGWIGGGMLLSDPATPPGLAASIPYAHYVASASGALLVVLLGKWMASRHGKARELAANDPRH